MCVAGKSITVEQAKEIILATDSFLTHVSEYVGGNNREWNKWARDQLGYSVFDSNPDGSYGPSGLRFGVAHEKMSRVEQLAGFLKTEYVQNSWASCAFVGGPHGWCHPDGTVRYADNVGKWPSVSEVAEEWEVIGQRWPFLDVWVTLMSGESCEVHRQSVVTFHLFGGELKFFEGTLEPLKFDSVVAPSMKQRLLGVLYGDTRREQGLPDEWVRELGERTRPIVASVMAENEPTESTTEPQEPARPVTESAPAAGGGVARVLG